MSAASAGQFHHMIDIVPTILEVTGIKAPEMVNGIEQKPIEGETWPTRLIRRAATERDRRANRFHLLG